MPAEFAHRIAVSDDLAALRAVMALAIGELQRPFLSDAQVEASHAVMGLDSQLIADGTYFVIEAGAHIAGCGGWSRRATPFGGDHSAGRDDSLLDPARDAARVRAMYTHPDFVRRGVGRRILELAEAAAAEEGFSRLELTATLAGAAPYRAHGFVDAQGFEVPADRGVSGPRVRVTEIIR